jgi:hypothetical protein
MSPTVASRLTACSATAPAKPSRLSLERECSKSASPPSPLSPGRSRGRLSNGFGARTQKMDHTCRLIAYLNEP